MKLLGIDTSGNIASVAVCDENSVIATTTFTTKLTHSQVILPLVTQVLEMSGFQLGEMDGFAVAVGPGSYTGLRIGISAVKGISFGLEEKPCYGVSTLLSLAYNVVGNGGFVASVMKARADLVYCGFFDCRDRVFPKRLTADEVISAEEVLKFANDLEGNVTFVGDSADIFTGDNFTIAPPHLRLQMASSLCFCGMNGQPVTPDELLPDYLQITKAEKDRLGG